MYFKPFTIFRPLRAILKSYAVVELTGAHMPLPSTRIDVRIPRGCDLWTIGLGFQGWTEKYEGCVHWREIQALDGKMKEL